MIEKSARVLRLEGELAVLEVAQQSSCGSCSARSGCGTSVLSGLFGRKAEFRAYNKIKAEAGAMVTVAIPERVLVTASLLMYLLPLVLMIIAAAVGQSLMQGSANAEFVSILSGLGGFFSGILVYRIAGSHLQSDPDNLPVLVKQVSPIGVTISAV